MKAEYRHRTSKNGRTLKVDYWKGTLLEGNFVEVNHAFIKRLLKKAGYKKVVRK